MITSKRVYDEPKKDDGIRILVDRLWPRGIHKEDARIDHWAKEIAPSNELRRWFHQDRDKRWQEFSARYQEELEHNVAIQPFRIKYTGKSLTLITAARDVTRSHIPILQRFLRQKSES